MVSNSPYKPGMTFYWLDGSNEAVDFSLSVMCIPTGWLLQLFEDSRSPTYQTIIPDKDHLINPRSFWLDYEWGAPENPSIIPPHQELANSLWRQDDEAKDNQEWAELLGDHLRNFPWLRVKVMGVEENQVFLNYKGTMISAFVFVTDNDEVTLDRHFNKRKA